TELTHIGTIPSYHMHKLGQKRRGSKIKFKAIDASDAHAEAYGHYLWVNSLFKAIDYKISKELVKEKMKKSIFIKNLLLMQSLSGEMQQEIFLTELLIQNATKFQQNNV